MFWGLIMEPHKRYTQTVEKSFHVSMASLDVSTAGTYNEPVQIMMNYENRNYLLCTLQKGTALQVPLDLNFQEGTKIAFTSNGVGYVHLTGYIVPEEDDFDDELEEEEEEEEDAPQLVGKSSKRKALDILNQSQNSNKRSKHQEEEESSDDDDDDDEDDSELGDELKEDDDEEDEDEDDEVEDEEEEDQDDDEEEEEVVKQPAKKNKQNKQQQQQQQQQQQNKKQEKQKLTNGKDIKQDQKSQEKKSKVEKQSQNNKQEQKKRVIEGGVQVEDLKVGNGAPAKSGKFVSVYYVGRLKNGKKFDSCNQGEGFKFRLGKKEVIQGWDVGIAGMKIGGKRRITIPPAFAYGAKGSPPVIPPNSQLVFEVELKNVH